MAKDLWRIAFGDDGVSGYGGYLRGGGFDRKLYEETRDYIKDLVRKIKNGQPIPKGDVPALCWIIHDSCIEYDNDDIQNALNEILDILEELLDKDIKSFRGEYAFLSNFYDCDVEYDGITYKNSEAAFQAQKCIDPEDKNSLLICQVKKQKNLAER